MKTNQGKTPKQMKDSLFNFEVGFWAIVAIILLMLLFSSVAEAKPPKTRKCSIEYRHQQTRKSLPFAKFKTTRINRKGLTR